jgi:hypothetical protein
MEVVRPPQIERVLKNHDKNDNIDNNKHAYAGSTDSFTHLRVLIGIH